MTEQRAGDLEIQTEHRSEEVAIQDANQDLQRLTAHADQRGARSGVEHEQAQAWAHDGSASGYRSPRR